jgi:hypothetical protein
MTRSFESTSETLRGRLSLKSDLFLVYVRGAHIRLHVIKNMNSAGPLNLLAKHPINSNKDVGILINSPLTSKRGLLPFEILYNVMAGGNRVHYSKVTNKGNKLGTREKKLMHINHRSIKDFTTIEFGSYLAGLWEADGFYGKDHIIVIAFSELDLQFAHLLCDVFRHGNVYLVKNKRACVWSITNKEGVIKFLKLIDGNIRIPSKLQQIVSIIYSSNKVPHCIFKQKVVNTDSLLNSYWLAGFADGDGGFYVQIIDKKSSKEVRLLFKIALKCEYSVHCISNTFGGGYVGRRRHPVAKNTSDSKITFYWSSTSYEKAYKVHDYFHKYHLQSSKWLNFLKWRKVLRYLHFSEHKNPSGLAKIVKIENSMNSLLTPYDVNAFYSPPDNS